MKTLRIILTIFLVFLFSIFDKKIYSQTISNSFINNKTIGGFTSVGISQTNFKENSTYNPVFAGILLRFPLKKSDDRFNLSLNSLPHFGIAQFSNKSEYELGINMILELAYVLSKKSTLSLNMGTGPHYISVETTNQANGFIFSDMLYLSFNHKIKKTIFGLFTGFRHISNAGFKEPNGGINNYTAGLIISKLIKKSQ
jgi:hypothetical protein